MRLIKTITSLLFVIIAVAGCASSSLSNLPVTQATNITSLRYEALALVNQARKQQGAAPLKASRSLNAAAQAHAEDMARRSFYNHRSPEGVEVAARYQAGGGGVWDAIGENILYCNSCASAGEQVRRFQESWMKSPGHRRNILRSDFEEFGFGMAQAGGKIYAVQTFVRQRQQQYFQSGMIVRQR